MSENIIKETEETKTNFYRNTSGYFDPVAGKVLHKMNKEDERFYKLLRTIFSLCDLAGFRIEGRITFVEKRSGRIFK